MKPFLLAGLTFATAFSTLALPPLPSWGQTDPGTVQEEEAAKKKLLPASDQIDLLQQNVDSQTQQIAALRAQLDQARADLDAQKAATSALQSDNAALHAALEKMETARAEERKVLIDQVAKMVADAGKHAPPAEAPEAPKPSVPADANAGGDQKDQKGYDYVVVKGDTLSAIAAAYAAQGVKVTIDDLRKANNLSKTDTIHVGQKLFVPKK